MRYVIVCLIKGEALQFHEKLVEEICYKNKVKRQHLPAHFTIKAPFETDEIGPIEELTAEYCKKHAKTKIDIKDFGNFRDSVVFMAVNPSDAALKVHDDYIDLLKEIPWLEWKNNESKGKNKTFHCTLVAKLFPQKFQPIWEHVSGLNCDFHTYFDNISILSWEKDRWVTYREFNFAKNSL